MEKRVKKITAFRPAEWTSFRELSEMNEKLTCENWINKAKMCMYV